ncbi:MAG: hypothetical protein ACFB2X_15060 [Rivularia sp. (in: cyanobacteria)]
MSKIQKRPVTSLKLRNHITPRSRQIQGELKNKFGLRIGRLIAGMTGDVNANKELGEMARQGRMMSEFAPLVAEKATEVIQGTQAFNEAVSKINIASGQAGTAIDSAADAAELANVKWIDGRKLRLIDMENQRDKQEMNTQNAENHMRLKGEIDLAMVAIDGNYKMLQAELRPEIQDAQLQEAHTIDMAKYNLEMGNRANPNHKPLKQYGGKGMVQRIKDVLLGF